MARIFTTSFEYNHKTYDALVTLTHGHSEFDVNVKLLDEVLLEILPGGLLHYEGRDGFKELAVSSQEEKQLIDVIGGSIEAQLVAS